MLKRVVLIAVAVFVLAGCTPQEVAWWRWWYDSQQTCHGAVDVLWPASSRAWAHRIVDRESRGIATAQNPGSSAAGCFQIIKGTWLANADGEPWAHRYDPAANVRVALRLYQRAGAAPWS